MSVYKYPIEVTPAEAVTDHHRRGHCSCHNHIEERFYNGHALCMRCNRLAPYARRPKVLSQ